MRVVVDPETCMGHGQCYARAAQVYLPGDEGVCGVIEPEVDVSGGSVMIWHAMDAHNFVGISRRRSDSER